MAGLLRLANTSTGRTTVTPSASSDITVTLPNNGGTLLTNNYAGADLTINAQVDITGAGNGLTVDTDLLVVDANTNEVGIGLSNPSALFHVKAPLPAGGNIAFFDDSGSTSTGRLQLMTTGGANSDTFRAAIVNRNIGLGSASQNYLFINGQNGRVGIGTDVPQAVLHLRSSVITETRFETTDGTPSEWRIGTGSGSSGLNGNFRIYDEANSASRFVINTAGRVGIGTDTPSVLCMLEVNGSIFGSKYNAEGQTSAPGGGTAGYLDQGDKIVTGNTNSNNIYPCSFKSAPRNSTTDNSGVLGNYCHFLAQQMTNSAGSSIVTQRVFDCSVNLTDTATNTQGYVSRLNTGSNNNFNIYSSGTAPNYFNGDVGIGTTSATEKLHVVGNIRLTGGVLFTDDGTSAGTVDNKLFNDYEEGSFTPTVVGSSTAGTIGTYSQQAGQYTKIGNTVTAMIKLKWNGGTGGAGGLLLAGLPYACNSGGSKFGAYNLSYASDISTVTSGNSTFLKMGGGNITMGLRMFNNGTTNVNGLTVDWAAQGVLCASVVYYTDD